MYASTKGGGMTTATVPNVCKVPAPPAPPVPTPFPSIGQVANANGGTCTSKVKFLNKEVLHVKSEITTTSGDEPGTLLGVSAPFQGDKVRYTKGSTVVKVEGNAIVRHLDPIGSNGASTNAPNGMQASPSQTKVIVES